MCERVVLIETLTPNTDLYGDTFVTMSNFTTSSSYPYGTFEVKQVERTRTVPNKLDLVKK